MTRPLDYFVVQINPLGFQNSECDLAVFFHETLFICRAIYDICHLQKTNKIAHQSDTLTPYLPV